jgi:hypothetical protein
MICPSFNNHSLLPSAKPNITIRNFFIAVRHPQPRSFVTCSTPSTSGFPLEEHHPGPSRVWKRRSDSRRTHAATRSSLKRMAPRRVAWGVTRLREWVSGVEGAQKRAPLCWREKCDTGALTRLS